MLSSLGITAQTEVDWSGDASNCAKGKTVYISKLHVGDKANIVDANLATTCQLGINETSSTDFTEWIVVDLGLNYDITQISITTSGNRYDTAFKVYGAASQTDEPQFADGTDALSGVDGAWTELLNVAESKEKEGEVTATYEVSGTVRYIKYQGVTRNAKDIYGVTMNEIRVKGTVNDENASKVTSLQVILGSITSIDASSNNNKAGVVVNQLNKVGENLGQLANDQFTLTSSNTEVATIQSEGQLVVAVGYGTSVITATLNSDASITGSATFTLENPDVDHIALTLPSLTVGSTAAATVTKYNAGNTSLGACAASEVTLTASPEGIVTIDGLNITGTAMGSVTITATYNDNNALTASATADVAKNWESDDALNGGTYNAYSSSLREGKENDVVGKSGTFSTKNPSEDTEQWWFVDLGKTYNVTNIGLKQTNTYAAEFEVYTASALKEGQTVVSNDNVDWSDAAVATGTCSSDNYTATVAVNQDNVQYIKIHCTKGGGLYDTYGMAFSRFYLEGKSVNAQMDITFQDMTVEGTSITGTNKKAICSGDWEEDKFKELDAWVIDLTSVSGLPSTIDNNSKNPNAVVYAPSTVSGPNVCTGKNRDMAKLSLTDGYDFAPEGWFNLTEAEYTVSLTAGHYSFAYCPFNITEVPSDVHLYKISTSESSQVSLEEITSNPQSIGTNGRECTYIIKADQTGTYTIKGATCSGSSASGHNTEADKLTIIGSMVKGTIPAGAWVFTANNSLAKVEGSEVTLWPFGGYIAENTVLNATSGAKINMVEGDATGIEGAKAACDADNAVYNLAGQRVGSSFKGIVIKNGKKYVNK